MDFPSALAQPFRQMRWFQLLAAAFQPAAQMSGRLCSLWLSSRELPALAQPFRQVHWFRKWLPK